MSVVQTAEQAASDWEELFVDGKMPYTDEPFPSVQAIIEMHLAPEGSRHLAIDVGAGSGRAVRWLLEKLGFQKVIAVEPTKNGCQTLKGIASDRAVDAVRVIHDTAQAGLAGLVNDDSHAGCADLILWDSVLSFLPESDRASALADSLRLLKEQSGIVVITSHPDERPGDAKWVVNLLQQAAGQVDGTKDGSIEVALLAENATAPFEMTFEGEKLEAAFVVTVASLKTQHQTGDA